jgi:histidine triad (HIT) family protein
MNDSECPFCEIVNRVDSRELTVHETDQALVIMDIQPINPDHLLVVPKTHVEDFFELGDEVYASTMRTAKRAAQVLDARFRPVRVG